MSLVGTDPVAEGTPGQAGEEVGAAERPESWYSVVWSSKKARVGIVVVALYVLVALFAPLIAPHSPTDGSFVPLQQPSRSHLMGTSVGGQDIFSQLVYGSRISLLVGFFGGTLATAIALVVGLVSGYFEGTIVDDVLSFVTNVALVIPTLPLIITIVAYSDTRGLWLIVGVIAIISWAGAARGKRAQIITLRNRDFVTAAKFAGEGPLRIIFAEIMPNMTSLVAAAFVGAATGAIAAEAGLAVLGLGSSDSVSWGTILYQAEAAGAASQGLFAWVFVPGLVLAVLVTAMSFINFGVDLLSNPHLREG
ncbi:peptide/nickel transport system permease protein [Friedmanniella luteola]|uniref:Peptide/nickel transport system permease protein n=1 Tax=Friedmanniella luteola TaxID=546871 RepID=A0A1H1SKE2_9ACTN|nr:ABC transporter permease [Friedmanniella luteola]SDS48490.1 peptide/nickel transport system permease protein [Friedmanniella luteola]